MQGDDGGCWPELQAGPSISHSCAAQRPARPSALPRDLIECILSMPLGMHDVLCMRRGRMALLPAELVPGGELAL